MTNYVNWNGVKTIFVMLLLISISTFSKADDNVKFYGNGTYETWTVASDKITFSIEESNITNLQLNHTIISNYTIDRIGDKSQITFNLNSSSRSDNLNSFYQAVIQLYPNAELLHTIKPITTKPALADKEFLIDNKVLVRFNTPLTKAALNQFMDTYGLTLVSNNLIELQAQKNYTYIFKQITIDPGYNAAFLAAKIYEENDNIEVSQPNRVNFIEPNGEAVSASELEDAWHLTQGTRSVCGQNGEYATDINIQEAWSNGYTGQGIKVGVIDFYGFDYDHPDMVGQFLPGWNCINNTSYDASNYFYTNSSNAHGMAVAGIIGMIANNNIGGAGIAYNSKIVPFLIDGSEASIIIAFQKAISSTFNVDVINCSFGSYFTSPAITIEIDNATTLGRNLWGEARGIVIVASHGNDNYNDSEYKNFPSELDNVISVGATTPDDRRKIPGDSWDGSSTAWGSNYGKLLNVMAPGVCIYTTDYSGADGYYSGDYIYFNRTSAAAPIVSGLAVLILSKDPQLTYREVADIIIGNTDKPHSVENEGLYDYNSNSSIPGHSIDMGYGRINVNNSLKSTPVSINENINETTGKLVIVSPVLNELNINYIPGTSQEAVTLVLYDVSGKALGREALPASGGRANMDVSTLLPGIYFSQIVSDDMVLDIQKFVKIR